MKFDIKIEELKKLPHSNLEDQQGRVFPMHGLYEPPNQWTLWFPNKEGKLTPIKTTPREGSYFGKEANSPLDIIFPLVEFIDQHALWPNVYPWLSAIINDIHNLASSLAKLDILFETFQSKKTDIHRMVGTELEYIFLTCKSSFDLLQKILSELWKRIDLTDKTLKKRNLPERFKEVLLKGNSGHTLKNIEEIAKEYQLPKDLAELYHKNGQFFKWLRDFRIKVNHKDGEFELVFITEKGPAISTNQVPFKDMPIWTKDNTLENNLGSVKSAACYIINSTLKTLDDFATWLKNTIKWPSEMVPGYRIYTRGIYNKQLIDLQKTIEKPW